jgi:hypothetical protein
MISLKEIVLLPLEQRQVLSELIGYSMANDLKLDIFKPEQKKIIENRLKKLCSKKTSLFTFDEVKTLVLDKIR